MDSGTKIFTPQRSFVMKSTKHFLSAAISIALALAFFACDSGGGGGGSSTCGGKQYDQAKYGCVNDELVGTCNGSYYNPEYERCNNGQVQDGAEITFPSSSGGGNGGYSGSYGSVSHGGQTYKTVRIGNQTWMAKNLNYNASGSMCYDNNQSNCAKYGRLYNWATARTVCPTGWHLPSDAEWTTLTNFIGNEAGRKLKATSGWNNNGNGTDDYGFAALPGGYGGSDGGFNLAGYDGLWWSSSEYDASDAYAQKIGRNFEGVNTGYSDKSYLFSVRCLQN
jgi:uncharacterized protein (TIGR02145 family)